KLRIIELAEMAAQVPETEAMPTEPQEPDTEPEETSAMEEATQPAEGVEMENEVEDEVPTADEPPAQEEEPAREEPALMSDEEFYFDPGAAEQAQPETYPEADAAEAPLPESRPDVDLSLWRSLFSINDMYLFRRELFNGSEALMADALATIGTAESLDQVRAILADRYGIDLRTRTAKDFITAISTLF
ncbi:MAG: hypothetical protein K2I51_03075, partial [Muribaculaceae bacterium]|nr:hypothetical protein [Muribaculaceae bacterium]